MATVEENLLKVNEGIDKVEALNAELARSLYGGDTGYRGHYDEFWDRYQQNGGRTDYSLAFGGLWWDDIFKPKYQIKPTTAYRMFEKSKITTIPYIDFSNCTVFSQAFNSSAIKKIGVIDTRAANNLQYILNTASSLVECEKIILREDGSQTYAYAFDVCNNLTEIRFEGVIGQSGFNVKWSTNLSKASITSIINALSTATSGLSVTLSKTAVESAFGSTTSTEWTNLIGTRSNWTISLV